VLRCGHPTCTWAAGCSRTDQSGSSRIPRTARMRPRDRPGVRTHAGLVAHRLSGGSNAGRSGGRC
jgi:hypothetical protein